MRFVALHVPLILGLKVLHTWLHTRACTHITFLSGRYFDLSHALGDNINLHAWFYIKACIYMHICMYMEQHNL